MPPRGSSRVTLGKGMPRMYAGCLPPAFSTMLPLSSSASWSAFRRVVSTKSVDHFMRPFSQAITPFAYSPRS